MSLILCRVIQSEFGCVCESFKVYLSGCDESFKVYLSGCGESFKVGVGVYGSFKLGLGVCSD